MLRTANASIALDSMERFLQMYPDAEEWMKENFDPDKAHWDTFENFRTIAQDYFEQKSGEYIILSNRHDESILVIEVEEISYCITGEVDGSGCEIHFGTREELERFYLTYARKNYNSALSSYQDAKMWIEDNWDNSNGIVMF